jgi:hypothetical protein
MKSIYWCRLKANLKSMLVLIVFLCLTFVVVMLYIIATKSNKFDSEQIERFKNRIMRPKYSVSCKMLFLGHVEEKDRTRKLLNSLKSEKSSIDLLPDSNFVFRKSKCDLFREIRGYDNHKTVPFEHEFPLAFIILVDNNVEQFERFLRTVYRAHNVYCIHVDNKGRAKTKLAIESIVDCFDNVFITTKTEIVYYAHFSLLKAQLNCMGDLLNMNELMHVTKHTRLHSKKVVDWKYVLNAASTFLPLKTNLELVRILSVYNGSSDVNIMNDSRFLFRHKTRFAYDIFRKENIDLGIPKSAPPFDFKIMKGSNYIAASKSFVDYVINSESGKDLTEWSRDTVIFVLIYFCAVSNN